MRFDGEELTPKQLWEELNRYIVGQDEAKRAVAIALRNRWRRLKVEGPLKDEIVPKNIMMIGPTGVGKTEIARRLASIVKAPFIKVEASKYTEVGYVGRDVEGIIRDLVEVGIAAVRQEEGAKVAKQASERALRRVARTLRSQDDGLKEMSLDSVVSALRKGGYRGKHIQVKVEEPVVPSLSVFSDEGMEELGIRFEQIGAFLPKQTKERVVTVEEALKMFETEERDKLLDGEKIKSMALERVQNNGIVFIDEMDKIAGRESGHHGPDVSREGVQRDLLPIVEGTSVNTRHGIVRTDHILFIGAGAFHVAKVSDLIPELQGRFPIRVELSSLGKDDFVRILKEPENSLLKQYQALLATEGVTLVFEDESVDAIAQIAADLNARFENIGARRLHTVLEKVLEEISFHAPECSGQTIPITASYVHKRLEGVLKDEDLSRYIL
jgi:ATP-dependent HslUV protease ATP-binding subunit HslU